MHLDLLVLLVVSVGCLGSGLWIAYRGLHPGRPAEAAASMPQGALVFDPDGLEHGVACSLLLHLGILSLLLIVGPISSGTRAVPVGNTTALPGNFHVFLASLPEERKRSRLQTAAPAPVLPPHRVSVASGMKDPKRQEASRVRAGGHDDTISGSASGTEFAKSVAKPTRSAREDSIQKPQPERVVELFAVRTPIPRAERLVPTTPAPSSIRDFEAPLARSEAAPPIPNVVPDHAPGPVEAAPSATVQSPEPGTAMAALSGQQDGPASPAPAAMVHPPAPEQLVSDQGLRSAEPKAEEAVASAMPIQEPTPRLAVPEVPPAIPHLTGLPEQAPSVGLGAPEHEATPETSQVANVESTPSAPAEGTAPVAASAFSPVHFPPPGAGVAMSAPLPENVDPPVGPTPVEIPEGSPPPLPPPGTVSTADVRRPQGPASPADAPTGQRPAPDQVVADQGLRSAEPKAEEAVASATPIQEPTPRLTVPKVSPQTPEVKPLQLPSIGAHLPEPAEPRPPGSRIPSPVPMALAPPLGSAADSSSVAAQPPETGSALFLPSETVTGTRLVAPEEATTEPATHGPPRLEVPGGIAITSPRDGYTPPPDAPPLILVEGQVEDRNVPAVRLVANGHTISVPVRDGRFRKVLPLVDSVLRLRAELQGDGGGPLQSREVTIHAPSAIPSFGVFLMEWPEGMAGNQVEFSATWRGSPERLDVPSQRVSVQIFGASPENAPPEAFYFRIKPGVYTFLLRARSVSMSGVRPSLYLPQGNHLTSRQLRPVSPNRSEAVLAKILFPHGVLWEQDDWFTGESQGADTVTKFRFPEGISWTERKRDLQ